MKKFLTVLLSLCMLVSLATCIAMVTTGAEEADITVGQVFEWNDQSKAVTGDAATELAWRTGKATSPDGNWKYHFYSLNKKMYQPVVIATGNIYAWNKDPGSDDNGLGYARVRKFGAEFHPGYAADIVKTFTCPSGGSIQISTTVARGNNLEAGKGTGTSFAIYKENTNERTLVYPEAGAGEYLTLVSTTPQTVEVTVDVAKGERIHIHIGAMEDQNGDVVTMSNTITYKSISDDEVEGPVTNSSLPSATGGVSYTNPGLTDKTTDGAGSGAQGGAQGGGLTTGAIVGIVIGAVAVVGIAVAVVVILKKKKQD